MKDKKVMPEASYLFLESGMRGGGGTTVKVVDDNYNDPQVEHLFNVIGELQQEVKAKQQTVAGLRRELQKERIKANKIGWRLHVRKRKLTCRKMVTDTVITVLQGLTTI